MTRAVTTGSTVGSLLALSVILRALFPGVAVPSAPTGPAAVLPTTSVGAPADVDLTDGPWKASQRFFAGAAEVPECDRKPAGDPARWCISGSTSVLALIAIAPDPVRTHMALQFDRALEAIELAAASAGYVISQYWLPWSVEPPKGSDTAEKSSDSNVTPRQRDLRAAQPGLLLLRRNAGKTSPNPELVYIFLAADTATTGIDGQQFANAVNYLDEVCVPLAAAGGCKPTDPIRIIGPTFSGSLASLKRLTDARSKRRFIAYSGSVSSTCAMVEQGLATPPGSPCSSAGSSGNLSLRSFVFDTEEAVARFVETLQHSHAIGNSCGMPQVAILSEGATTFGQVTSKPGSACVQNFVFPREISNLRNASRATDKSPTGASSDPSAPKPFLPLDLTDRTNSNDAPPDFSTKQGPLSKEAVLMTLAAELRRARYRYVGIVSTNVLDALYLSEFLRAACPDARLFTISADQLFEREIDNVPYVGMLAITTYPLFLRNSDWTMSSGEPRLPFADEYEQGGYNAMLQTMNELLQRRPEVALNQFLPPGRPATSVEAPPLWMTVVGADGYWPVELLSQRAEPRPLLLTGADFSGAWQVLVMLISGLAALHVGVLLTASPFSTRFRDFAPMTAVPRQRVFYIQTASATLVFGLGLLLVPAWRYGAGWQEGLGTLALEGLGTLAMVAVILAALLSEALYYLRWKWQVARDAQNSETKDPEKDKAARRPLHTQILIFVAVWAATAGLLALWCALLLADQHTDTHAESSYGFFFAYRIVHPVTGISPLPPLIPLLITMYAWSCFQIWRLRFNENMRPRLFFGTPTGPSDKRQRPGERTEQRIADAINKYLLRPPYLVTGVVLFIVWLAFLHPERPFELFEHQGFSVLYTVLFCLVVALMLSSAFRMMQIWVDLRQLLIDLERSPVRAAFSRVKGLSWSFWRQGGEDTEWVYMSRALEKLGQLGSGSGSPQSGLPAVPYFAEQIDSFRARVRTLTARFSEPNAVIDADSSSLKTLADDVATFRHRLKLGDPNPFLQAAVDDLCRAVKTCALLRDNENNESVRSALAAVAGRLGDAGAALNLMTESTTALGCVGTIIKPWRKLQETLPLFFALHSFREYRAAVNGSTTTDDSRIALYGDIETAFRGLQEALARVLGTALDVIEATWSKDAPLLVDYDSGDRGGRDKTEAAPDPAGRNRQCLEEFIGLRYVAFIRGVLGHLRHVMIFLALSFSLVLVSLNIYSFEPHQSLIWSFTLIFVVAGVLVVSVLMQLHRDPILSRVTGTTGNALDIHFYLRIVAFGALPLLTLLATHFPSIGHYFLSFLRPSLEALK
jgi:hypothetical protein